MDYRETLNLPKTDFPMKADLAHKEVKTLARWEEMNLYRQLQDARAGKPHYILHDGPPYANGYIHIGTALNKILKDFVVKSRSMQDRAAPFVPGWDCHGLPIEHQVMKSLGPKKQEMSKLEIRKLCREYAEEYFKIQREEFKRLGVLGDWEHPYLTMTPDYEAAIVRELGKVIKTEGVYKGKKPVLWCPNDETALAEAEVEYENDPSPSIYVKFEIMAAMREGSPISNLLGNFILIWTTTPWTLPANQAIAVHPTENYLRIEVKWKQRKEIWILAEKLYKSCMEKFGLDEKDYRVIGTPFKGSELKKALADLNTSNTYRHPFLPTPIMEILTADFVTMDQGTGCVHIAPGHGQEDYQLFQSLGGEKGRLKMAVPVDDQGRFTDEVGVEGLSGKNVFKANDAIIQLLNEKNSLIHRETITHSYPHCWRCKKPVIFRATEQWFISMEKGQLRRRAIDEINRLDWIPKWGKDRILGMIENRPDWCISRQRVWGVPIVAFTCLGCKEPLFSQEISNFVADRIEQDGGSDIWFSKSADELLPKGTTCPKCNSSQFEKENDILDVWFESGVSHAAVLKIRPELAWPADLYLEGSDQHRGWFHSSLLASVSTDGQAPYRAVLTHGFVVDGAGKKMSKSAGNVIAPQEVIKEYGAEILRLWVAATDFREDIRISREIISHLIEAYRKIRNTCRFLLGNLYDYDPERDRVKDESLEEIDRLLLHRLQSLIHRIRKAYEDFEFHLVFHSLNQFCAVDLSALYLDVIKDRLYSEKAASPRRRSAQRVLHECLIGLTRLMAPVLSFTAEEVWQHIPREALPPALRKAPSVHVCAFPESNSNLIDESLAARWERLLNVRTETARVLEGLRVQKQIGSSLDAKVTLYAKGELHSFLQKHIKTLAPLFIVSTVELKNWDGGPPAGATVGSDLKDLAVAAETAGGKRCDRCWRYLDTVGRDSGHPTLCDRCADAVRT